MQKARMILAVVILVISLSLLAWGLWPVQRERRVLPVSPTEMTLPTPSSFEPGLLIQPLAGLPLPCSDAAM